MSSTRKCAFNFANDKIPTSWSRSEMKVTEMKHKWTIDNIMYQNLEGLKSAPFSSPGPDRSCFRLFLTNFGTVDVRLCVLESREPIVIVKWKLTIYKGGVERFSKVSSQDRLKPNKNFTNASIIDLGMSEKELTDATTGLLNERGGLTIVINLGIIEFGSTMTTSGSSIKTLTSRHAVDFSKQVITDLSAAYETRRMSDVTLVVGGKEIPASKFVLAARSPVFDAMFSNEFRENAENRVVIEDVDLEVFEVLLKYLYTGQCEAIELHAAELMMAADLYGLDQLKSQCEQVLALQMTAKIVDAPALLQIADRYNAQELKEKVVQYIQRNTSEVIYLLCKTKQTDKLVALLKEMISNDDNAGDCVDLFVEVSSDDSHLPQMN